MEIYHLLFKINYNPNWGERLAAFWSTIKSYGVKTDEKVLYIENQTQIELIYKVARAHNIEIELVKE